MVNPQANVRILNVVILIPRSYKVRYLDKPLPKFHPQLQAAGQNLCRSYHDWAEIRCSHPHHTRKRKHPYDSPEQNKSARVQHSPEHAKVPLAGHNQENKEKNEDSRLSHCLSPRTIKERTIKNTGLFPLQNLRGSFQDHNLYQKSSCLSFRNNHKALGQNKDFLDEFLQS
jgi:hypothetical protein